MLYVLDGGLTSPYGAGREFTESIAERARAFHPVCVLDQFDALESATPGPSDGVAFVIGDSSLDRVEPFLAAAQAAGAVVLPVALDAWHRHPPAAVETAQAFDVADRERLAGSPARPRQWAARAFVREALARLAPTCYRQQARFFLSYRRADGEGTTAALDRALSARHRHVFRDLIDIQVGEPAQDLIDRAVDRADVVVFIDTPRAGESDWIARELATAMGNGTPIVWARLGDSIRRVPLPVSPGAAPLIDLGDARVDQADDWADAILDAAYDQIRDIVRRSMHAFRAISTWADGAGAAVATLDQRRLIYAVQFRAEGGALPRRPRQDIVQVFARQPWEDDVAELKKWLEDSGQSNHPMGCRSFDAAVLIRPGGRVPATVDDWGVIDTPDHYLASVSGRRFEDSSTRPVLLLLGAFPAEPGSHPAVIAAVSEVARTWLRLGGTIRFGSHPTFTPLVAEAQRSVGAIGRRGRVQAYQSDFFERHSTEAAFAAEFEVRHVPAAASRDESLSAMRTAMIRSGQIAVAVIVGGRTDEGSTHVPGVRGELALAQTAGIPVVAIGSAGGEAARIAGEAAGSDVPWSPLANGLTDSENAALAFDDDFAGSATLLWSRYGASDRGT